MYERVIANLIRRGTSRLRDSVGYSIDLHDLGLGNSKVLEGLIGMTMVHKMVYHTFGMSFITSSICKYLKRG